jgi:Tfp pilus assembly protein FimT
LIELLVVIAIIAILAALAMPALTSARQGSDDRHNESSPTLPGSIQMANDGAATGDATLAFPGDLVPAPASDAYSNILVGKVI